MTSQRRAGFPHFSFFLGAEKASDFQRLVCPLVCPASASARHHTPSLRHAARPDASTPPAPPRPTSAPPPQPAQPRHCPAAALPHYPPAALMSEKQLESQDAGSAPSVLEDSPPIEWTVEEEKRIVRKFDLVSSADSGPCPVGTRATPLPRRTFPAADSPPLPACPPAPLGAP